MKKSYYLKYLLLALLLLPAIAKAQMSGTYTINNLSPTAGTNFNNFTDAITSLNTLGVVAAGVTINVSAGQTFTETPPALTASGFSTGSIVIQKSGTGANPKVRPGTAGTLTASAFGAHADGVIRIAGGDYIDINGVDIDTNAAYTTTAQRYEYGYYIQRGSATNGSQNITIRNCNIRLYALVIHSSGVFASAFDATGAAVTPTSTAGRNQNIVVKRNTFTDCYHGVQLRGYNNATAPNDLYDHFNIVDSNSVTAFGGTSTESYGIYTIYQDSLQINYNTLYSNLSAATIYGIRTETAVNATLWVKYNTVTVRSSSLLYGILNNSGSAGTNNLIDLSYNTVRDCKSTGSTFTGIRNQGDAVLAQISNNNIFDDTVVSGSSAAYVIWSIPGGSGVNRVFKNHIYNIRNIGTTGGGTTFPIIFNSGGQNYNYQNHIHDIVHMGSTGLIVMRSNTANYYCYNNFIHGLYTPNSTAANAISAIEFNTGAANQNAYFNTVYLDATSSSATTYGNSCLYVATSVNLDLRSNILVNMSTPGPTGGVVTPYRRSSTTLTSFVDSSNNNCFYAGTPAANRPIMFDGTNAYQTIATYKTAVGPVRDSASFSELPPFTNVATNPYDLHIPGSATTYCNNHGKKVLNGTISITNDFDDEARNALTPDVGADEIVILCVANPNAPTITTPAMTTPICNASTVITAVDPGAISSITYQWEQAPAATGPWTNVVGGSGATTLSYTTANLTATTYFRLRANCLTFFSTSSVYMVLIGTAQPSAITGNATFCPGNAQTYSVAAVPNATSYTWILPSGWTGTSTTNSITATPAGTAPGTISVTATGPCGTSPAQTLAVTIGAAPAQPGTITGATTFCSGISITYSIAAVPGAISYIWTLPTGWTGTSTTNSITVTTGANSGNVTVAAINGCGTSTPRTLAVTLSSAPASLGAITGNSAVCPGTSQTYSIVAVPGVVSYTWSLPTGWTGTSTTSSITVVTSATSGNVQVTGFNGCGNSAPQVLAVTVNPQVVPAVTITGPSAAICSGSNASFSAVAVNGGSAPTYQWKVNNIISGANAATFNSTTLQNNDVVTLTLTSNAACPVPTTANSNAITLSIIPNAVPGININATTPPEICEGTSITFYSNITDGGPTPNYQWLKNNNPVGSNAPTYTASNFANNDTVKCVLTTSALCPIFTTITSNKLGLKVSPVVTPSVTITVSPSSFVAPGQQVTFLANVTNGGAQPLYQWVKNSLDILGATNATYVANNLAHMDNISLRVVSSADCAFPNNVTSNRISITSTTSGIATTQGQGANINLYPNPNNGSFEIAAEFDKPVKGKMQIDILNTLGQLIYRSEENAPATTAWSKKINIDNVANGIYMLRLAADGKTSTKRFEINR